MAWHNTAERFGLGPRLLHWMIAILVIVALVFIETRGYAPKGSALRSNLRVWHQQVALVAFILVWWRLALRLRNTPPPIRPAPPAWQHQISSVVHALFYVLLFVLPLLGIVMVQTDGRVVSLAGLSLPKFMATDKDLTHQLENIHAFLGDVMIGAIVLHVVAVLWHQFVVRDNTLRRMV
jgi:cytochrome b561